MNSFIENVNYLASLDNNYGDGIVLNKNNLSLRNVANDVTLKFSYFNYNTKQIETVDKIINGMFYTGLETALQEFCAKIKSSLGGNKFYASFTIYGHNISITINSLDEKLKCTEINFNAKITSTQVEIYNLYGDVINPLKLLSVLAMLEPEVVDAIPMVYENIDSIIHINLNTDLLNDIKNNIIPNINEILEADNNALIASQKALDASASALSALSSATTATTALGNMVVKNADIVAGTGTKITYDTKGLVTGSATLNASDIPSLDASKIKSGTLSVGTSGNAATATRVNNTEVIKFDTGVTEGTDLYTFDGSVSKTINIKAGTNVTLTKSAGIVTINANDTSIAVTEITGMVAGASTFLATPTSTNLAAMLTDETGTGAVVFANSPTLTGTPLATTAVVGTNTTQVATTAYVIAEINKIEEW